MRDLEGQNLKVIWRLVALALALILILYPTRSWSIELLEQDLPKPKRSLTKSEVLNLANYIKECEIDRAAMRVMQESLDAMDTMPPKPEPILSEGEKLVITLLAGFTIGLVAGGQAWRYR